MNFKVGDKVLFGRTNGEQTLGEVVKVNWKSLKVKTLESRGTKRNYRKGLVWRVPPSLCRPADPSKDQWSPSKATKVPGRRTNVAKGDRVTFLFRGRHMTGTVRRVNKKTISVNPDPEFDIGKYDYLRVDPLTVQRELS